MWTLAGVVRSGQITVYYVCVEIQYTSNSTLQQKSLGQSSYS